MRGAASRRRRPVLGLRANLAQFVLLMAVNALVGGLLGQERTVLPLLAEREFGIATYTTALTFVAAFGVVKAATNLVAGAWSDRYGRKPVLVVGWLVGLPVPLLLMWAPTWGWVIAANVLLGVNQGLTWSTTVIMKIDLVGSRRRGLAMGLNEAAGYGALALTALATAYVAARYGLRPAPFLFGLAYVAVGLGLSTALVRDTSAHVTSEIRSGGNGEAAPLPFRDVLVRTTVREPALSAASQAGLVNNLNDGMAWGLLPVLFAGAGLSLPQVGVLAAAYPAVWGVGQLATGAWSDRVGRRRLIAAGLGLQALALAGIALATGFGGWLVAMVALGVGTALAYPTLLAAVADVAGPGWRARAVGVYRFWRDLGFAVGALGSGLVADLFDVRAAVWVVAGVTLASAVVVLVRMYETLPAKREPAFREPVTPR